MRWEILINETALKSVLPADYARFALPISEGLAVFLDGLPDDRQQQILSEQAALPVSATSSERLALLARSCPSLHKLGQIVARDRRLQPELRSRLQELESLPPSVPLETICESVHRELGPPSRLGITLDPPALAEASVAVVIPYRETGASNESFRRGVLKILKPGIEEQLDEELKLFERVGSHLDERCEELGIPQLDYQETFEQVREKLSHEVKLDVEQQNLKQAASLFREFHEVQIPALFEEHCTTRITAMERVFGIKVTDHSLETVSGKGWLAGVLVRALLAQPIFSREKNALFHADPHAGNLLLTTENRLAILDWSLVGALRERERIAMTQIILAGIALNPQKIVMILEDLDRQKRLDRKTLVPIIERWSQSIRRGTFPDFDWLMGMLDEAVHKARLRVSSDLMLFRKTLQTLEGVVADVGGVERSINPVLLEELVRRFVEELPMRWWAMPDARDFPTRLSNTDLAQLMLSFPLTATQLCWNQFEKMRLPWCYVSPC